MEKKKQNESSLCKENTIHNFSIEFEYSDRRKFDFHLMQSLPG